MKRIGFTTSIPVEVIFAAGDRPVDLNNVFITNDNPGRLVEIAENAGFPRNTCAWIKGIYSAIMDGGDIDTLIGVVEGDCSNARALVEVLEQKGVDCISFSYPNSRDYDQLKKEIVRLCGYFGVELEDCTKVKKELDTIRQRLIYLDELTWKHNKATGFENHIWQVSSSDFNGDYVSFGRELDEKIASVDKRAPKTGGKRIGYIGVPPINGDIYDFVESLNARVVYNEVQRQFTMADSVGIEDVVEVYRNFTYPYSLRGRLLDIKDQISKRKIDGIIHYAQAFCFRGIEDIVIRKELNIPVLTIEGDRPGNLDQRTKLRIEAFIDMLDQ
ncbi:MAG TPA: 2-hydroxyacyl-CoA dehydratase [Acetivibrio sp.]|nr:2-hydroxyacyl-CoA dehydratase [Acetivibrio sp.]